MKKVALVTGCKGGIGTAICRRFLNAGWEVVGTDIRGDLPADFDFYQLDLKDSRQLISLTHYIEEKYKRLDCLINNAASQICKPISETTFEDWDLVIDTNLKAPYFLIKNFLPLLTNAKGNIVNVSSIHAIATSKYMSAYAISKGGLSQLTRSLAIDLADDGIRVNAVLPGAILTGMLLDGIKRGGDHAEKQLQELSEKTVLKRIGQPEEIAGAVYYLADNDSASFITGLSLVVDGGATIKLSTE